MKSTKVQYPPLFAWWPIFGGVRNINEAPFFSHFGAEIEKRELSRNSTLSFSLSPSPSSLCSQSPFQIEPFFFLHPLPFAVVTAISSSLPRVSSSSAQLSSHLVLTVSFSDFVCFSLFELSVSYSIFYLNLS